MSQSGIYVLQGIDPSQIAAAPVNVKVVDLYDDNGNLFTPAQVSQMESGGGSVLGYFSIGEAENFRSYWSSLPSSIIGPQNPDWPGDYQVAYWSPQWLSVAENYIQTMINQGYQGAYFDVVDTAESSWAKQNAPGGNPEGAMVTLIQELANYARAQNPNFQIWINSSGAEPMLTNTTLLNTINGAYEEQLYYQNATQATDSADLNYNVNLLDNVTKAGKSVIAIEYVSGSTQVANVESEAKADGFGYYIANPNLQLDGVDTQGFAGLPSGSGSASGTGSTGTGSTGTGSTGTGSSGSGSGSTAEPTVAINGSGGAVTQASEKITGTVDVADAGSTVDVLDNGKQVATATVGTGGAWSATVTLAQGSNVITATDTNAAGTGTSDPVTYNYQGSTSGAGSTGTGSTGTGSTGTGSSGSGSGSTAEPTVAINGSGGTVTQASEKITGTVDVADASSTVDVLDNGKQVATATVGTSGAWSATVTLAQGSNVITATDTNAAGTGTSDPVTYNYQPQTPSTPTTPTAGNAPTLTVADHTLEVTGRGGTVDLGISVSAPSDATHTKVTITGLPSNETISDNLGHTFSGSSFTLSARDVNSGLTLTSNYSGSGHPTATLTLTAKDTVGGVAYSSGQQTITVNDPPPTTSNPTPGKLALLLQQYIAGGFDGESSGAMQPISPTTGFGHDGAFLANPRHS
jgi:uncharacterized protein (TIGR01370 family)